MTTGKGLPRIRGMQRGLRDPRLVDRLKQAMRDGDFQFALDEARIAGYLDRRGTDYVNEGHHRIAAALQLANETGDLHPLHRLLDHGVWTKVERPPRLSRPLPVRSFWGRLRNWLGY